MIEVLLLFDSECNCCSCNYYDDRSNDDNKYQLHEHLQIIMIMIILIRTALIDDSNGISSNNDTER